MAYLITIVSGWLVQLVYSSYYFQASFRTTPDQGSTVLLWDLFNSSLHQTSLAVDNEFVICSLSSFTPQTSAAVYTINSYLQTCRALLQTADPLKETLDSTNTFCWAVQHPYLRAASKTQSQPDYKTQVQDTSTIQHHFGNICILIYLFTPFSCYTSSLLAQCLQHKCLGQPRTMPASSVITYAQFYKVCGTFSDDQWNNMLAAFTSDVACSPAPAKMQINVMGQRNPMCLFA